MNKEDMAMKVMKLLKGRYGPDQLGNCILVVGMIFLFVSIFFRFWILDVFGLILIAICYLRIFSKNFQKRYKENQSFLKIYQPIKKSLKKKKKTISATLKSIGDKNFKYFVCPSCAQLVRVPKGKKKIEIKCPKCNTRFIRKS